jgi:hypothetical protein
MTERSSPSPASNGNYPYACDTSSMRSQHFPVRGVPAVLNPDYSQPQPQERTIFWTALGAGALITGLALAGCNNAENPSEDIPSTPPAVEFVDSDQRNNGSFLDAFGPITLYG